MDNFKQADLELGNMAFNMNTNQCYECPNYIIALLETIEHILCIKMWNKYQEEYESPFRNTGNKFKNDVFEVEAYNWNDDYEQLYNFKYKEIKINWYKYLGRDTTINKQITTEEAVDMFNDCYNSIQNIEEDEL